MSNKVLQLKHIGRSFTQGKSTLNILQDVSLDVRQGEIVAIVGPSGCGKSTLLQIAGLLDEPNKGTVVISGVNCTRINDRKRTQTRRLMLGFVYQYHHLLPEFSALENVILPQMISGKRASESRVQGLRLLEQFGLANRVHHRPAELSGGEQQRVAIARAIANHPQLLLADEPTGNLDPHTADDVFDVLIDQCLSRKLAMLMVTHNPDLARRAHRIVTLKEGVLVTN